MTGTSSEHLADLAKAMAAVDKAVMQLIVDELAEAMPALEAAEDQAATALREACAALAGREEAVRVIEAEVSECSAKLTELSGSLADPDLHLRVEAGRWHREYQAEHVELHKKLDFAVAGLRPFYDARNKAQGSLELVQGAKRGLAWSMVTPYESAVAQGTRAYLAFRAPRLSFVLLAGDRAHPEYDAAVAQLEQDATAAGFRLDRSPDAEREARAMTAAMADASSVLAPAPNAVEVMAADMVKFGNETMPPSRIEDHRNTPAPPRNAVVEPYRQVQSLRDMGIR